MNPTGRLAEEFAAITEHWSPRVIAMSNGQYVKLAKVRGEFVWHDHADEDELFLVMRGTLVLRFRDRPEVTLRAGDFHVVPRGVQHCPYAPEEAWIMLVEPAATKHTGDVESALTRSVETQTAHLR
ncbi:cupin [Mizugakiibacter sediminis]|uniref:Cupin n=1 Tax=Mizugakiibacter sediminis TaxID=1475481 RepID=A0A0K8QP72_9GAMM|nr:cupin domain-containing protein [Mizugakiibacter sediminis]GAP66212.1 cupin [Mizugakiibacter sediminis]